MIRPFTAICMLLAGGSGLYLYQAKHRSQMLEREIETVVHDADSMRERIGVLHAEWTLLNDPERLGQFADKFLPDLKTTQPGQFIALADIDKRLPPVRPPSAARGTTDIEETPEAASPPAPPPAAPAPVPVATAPPPGPAPAPAPPVIASGQAAERTEKKPISLHAPVKPARDTAEAARPVINLAPPRQAAAPPAPAPARVQTASLLGARPALPATQHPAAPVARTLAAPAPPIVHASAPAPAAAPVIHALAQAAPPPAVRAIAPAATQAPPPAPIRTAARAVPPPQPAPVIQPPPAPAATVSALGMARSYGNTN